VAEQSATVIWLEKSGDEKTFLIRKEGDQQEKTKHQGSSGGNDGKQVKKDRVDFIEHAKRRIFRRSEKTWERKAEVD